MKPYTYHFKYAYQKKIWAIMIKQSNFLINENLSLDNIRYKNDSIEPRNMIVLKLPHFFTRL